MCGLLGSWNALCRRLNPSSELRNLSLTCGKSELPAPAASSTRFEEVTEPHTKHVPTRRLFGFGSSPVIPVSGTGGVGSS